MPGQEILTVVFLGEVDDPLLAALKALPEVREVARDDPHSVRLILAGDVVPVESILEVSRGRANKMKSMTLLEPTLEDVFIHYTGRGLRDTAVGEYSYAVPSMMR